jgi:hypothetical protein
MTGGAVAGRGEMIVMWTPFKSLNNDDPIQVLKILTVHICHPQLEFNHLKLYILEAETTAWFFVEINRVSDYLSSFYFAGLLAQLV